MREIFLIDFNGMQYGVWKDEILSVKDITALHRIPLSPAYIAGVIIIDGQAVTLADLPVCLGYAPSSSTGQGSILLMEENSKITGFAISGQVNPLSVDTRLIFPVPGYLKTPVFDNCVVHNNIPIPLIKLSALYSQALQGKADFSADTNTIFAAHPQDISGIAKLRLFSAGGDIYAVSAAGIENKTFSDESISPLPNTPRYVSGVTFCDGRLLPVIDLPQRLKLTEAAPKSPMLIAELAGNMFGLLVDSDGGTLPAAKVTLKPLPMIAQISWLKHAVLRAGEIIPLLDLAKALSSGTTDETPVQLRYTPASDFSDQFLKRDVDVLEFSLLGERHALPKDEVEDVISYTPCRALPDLPSIVIGVTEHNGEILPVLDLAIIFGRRSMTTPAWRMILLNNGDFRALLLTETVYAERALQLETQRAVPIHLPHHLLYGCYPDDKKVRIILNVEAIAVHFEESLIQKFLPTLSPAMKMVSTEAGVTADAVLTGTPSVIAPESIAPQEHKIKPLEIREAVPQPAADKISPAINTTAPKKMPKLKQPLNEADDPFIEWEKINSAVPEIAPASKILPQPMDTGSNAASPASTAEIRTATDKSSTDKTPEQKPVPPKTTTAKKIIAPETIMAAEKQPEPPAPSAATQYASAAGNLADKTSSTSTQIPDVSKEFSGQKVSAPESATSTPAEPTRLAEAPVHNTPSRISPDVKMHVVLPVHNRQSQGIRRQPIVYAVIAAALLALLFYYAVSFEKTGIKKSATANVPATIEQTRVQAKLPPATDSPAPLELHLPRNMPPVEIDIYVVVQDDTLWSISERFTGDPYNYPRIAGENKLANPDLIFPGQRIRLIK